MGIDDDVDVWADGAPIPMILVDAERIVRWRNQAAHRLLLRDGLLAVRDGRIDSNLDSVRNRLASLMATATPVATLHVLGERSGEACLITCQRLPPPRDALVMLLLRPPPNTTWEEGVPLADISILFELTETETIVVRRLMSSQSPVHIAQALNIKLGTIRTHVRNIYAKMGVSSREGLFLRCLPFAWIEAKK